jgi:IMP dehydrogenase
MKFTQYDGLTFDDVLIEPAFSNIASRDEISLSQDLWSMHMWLPIISANMDYITGHEMMAAMRIRGGLGILHRFMPWSAQLMELGLLHNFKQLIPSAFSIGTRDIEDSLSRVHSVMEYPTTLKFPIVTVDIAHGHHEKSIKLIAEIKSRWPNLKVIAGNVATEDGASDLIFAGADAIKVGIGPGSVCTTRTVTGIGVPQLSAIANVAVETQLRKIPLIADGGIRNSGDIVKALAAGADYVMLGHLLAGTSETPGQPIVGQDGITKWKPYRGQSIFGSNGDRFTKEGISGYVREKGPVENVLKQLAGGIRSGMSYVGARNLTELRENARFIRVSGHTMHENNTRVSEVVE